ncbi:MAG: energy-coupling factor ABC transporter ATP-binding protein [Candidatus Methylomirabilales bacterium]
MALEVTALTYRYPAGLAPALREVSLHLQSGEFLGIVGPSGAGKSTLIAALAGLVPHFFGGQMEGRVLLNGLDTRHASVADLTAQLGLVLQNPFTQLTGVKETVEGEVAFGLENRGIARAEMRQRVAETLERLGLAALRDRHPLTLSGGQMQRVALASVLAMRPRILVCDEPTAQLDSEGVRDVMGLLADLHRGGTAIVLVEHRTSLLAEMATRVFLLADGRVLADGSPREVLGRPDLEHLGVRPPLPAMIYRQVRDLLPPDTPVPLRVAEARAALTPLVSTGGGEGPA